ncbi:S8 family serine peptidase [Bacillus sonorensis]|uniref:S8 family serine peptidase n=1 Tax=Bacillus sonorensis TaxID=119858 RepID=UPI0015C3AF58|nr:S8 family serine peptidase [Bacillus sonorensis]
MKKRSVMILYIMMLLTAAMFQQEPAAAVKDRPSAKISATLYSQFKQSEKVTFLIKLKEKADPKKAVSKGKETSQKNQQTTGQAEDRKRSAIVSSLRMTADDTQRNLKTFLKTQEKKGHADHIRSYYIVNAIAVHGTKEVMEKAAAYDEVEKILPNETRKLYKPIKTSAKISEPRKKEIEWNIEIIGSQIAWWLHGYDGSGTVVATINSGVEWDHPALKEKYRGYDPEHPDDPSHTLNWFDAVNGREAPYDDIGSGTEVMGTMVGSEPDGYNEIGVAPGAKWIAVKAFTDASGKDTDLLAAGEWILAPKDAEGNPHPELAPDVVYNAWGGGPGLDEWYKDILKTWREAEIFPVFAAGDADDKNPAGPGTISSPANYPEAFTVGSVNRDLTLSDFSLQGPSPDKAIKPELSAPGEEIRTSALNQSYEEGLKGTALAGAHVAGTAAILKQIDATVTPNEMKEILTKHTNKLTDNEFSESPNNGYGYGLVSVFLTYNVSKSIIKGEVRKKGVDEEPPSISHQMPTAAFENSPVQLTAQISDNTSVSKAELAYKIAGMSEWKTEEVNAANGNAQIDIYQTKITFGKSGQTLNYKWIATDFSGNKTESQIYELPISDRITGGYQENFESGTNGWFSEGKHNSWEWGTPASGPNAAASGEKVFATNLNGPYDADAEMDLYMPTVELPMGGRTYLRFKAWYELEDDKDFAYLMIRPYEPDPKWEIVKTYTGSSSKWIDEEIPLTGYKYRTSSIEIKWRVVSNGTVQKDGFYLDDVELYHPFGGLGLNSKMAKQNQPKPNDSQTGLPPVQAKVSIAETEKSTYSDPETGKFALKHTGGEYTLKAEAYGYKTVTKKVELGWGKDTILENLMLEEAKEGVLSGTIKDAVTGKPVENATLYLIEDASVTPAVTNGKGEYNLNAYQGAYTIRVLAEGYSPYEFTINLGENTRKNIKLKPLNKLP